MSMEPIVAVEIGTSRTRVFVGEAREDGHDFRQDWQRAAADNGQGAPAFEECAEGLEFGGFGQSPGQCVAAAAHQRVADDAGEGAASGGEEPS